VVVRHLKLTTKCFESSALKVEWYDYLTVTKRCYEFMSASHEPQDIFRELKANDLNEWIWNGAGFSSLTSIFIITEKDHPLCSHVAILPYELYVFVKFFERLGIKKEPDVKQLEQILVKCVKNSQKINGGFTHKSASSNEYSQLLLENAAKNYPLINWIKSHYGSEKKLALIIKDYEESLINISSLGSGGLPSMSAFINGTSNSTGVTSSSASSSASSSNNSSPTFNTNHVKNISNGHHALNEASIAAAVADENSSEYIFLYLPELYKSIEIKDNLIGSVMTLVKNRQIKILDEEAYLMRKVAIAAAAASTASTASTDTKILPKSNNIYDHYRVYNEIILPNLNSLSKNVKDSVVLFALDHADPKMLEILRDHPCIPVSPFGRRLKKPNKLVHPAGKLAPLYSDSDERFPCGSKDTYIREDRLQILKILGMKCDVLTWHELSERAESVSKIKEFDGAVERSIVILSVLNDMLNVDEQQQDTVVEEDQDVKVKVCELIRDTSFIPVKSKPYHRLALAWYGDKFKFSFAKPKELLAASYEPLCSTLWPVPLNEYKKKENLITKQVEAFLGMDELSGKFGVRDALKQLEAVCQLNIQEIDDTKEIKLVGDMCFQIYEYLQEECQKQRSNAGAAAAASESAVQSVRDFFSSSDNKKCILLNEEFVSVSQLCWHLNVNLKSMFYQMPAAFLRSFKYLFSQVLNVKVNLDLPDLLHVVDTMRKRYKDAPITSREDFNILMNVYGLMIDQGYQIITNLYLPNINGTLQPGRLLYFHPMSADQLDRPEEYVHPAVDRRICVIAGATMNKKMIDQNGKKLRKIILYRPRPKITIFRGDYYMENDFSYLLFGVFTLVKVGQIFYD
jgi:hypothetical protein